MSRQVRILIVDDQEKWRKELVETLQRNDFNAEAVKNIPEALERLSSAIYHIIVLDIHFENDDPGNTEGIDLLQNLNRRGLNQATKVIMLSGYGTLQQMREAFKNYDVADFVPKTDSIALLNSVQQVFAQKVKINLELNIQWQTKSVVEQIVSNLTVSGKRIGRNSSLRRKIIDELEDLFCRLFYEAQTVLVRPLKQGWSGSGVLLIQPLFKDKGGGQGVIAKFGDVNKIRKEYHNFQQYVKDFIGGGRNTTVLNLRYTPHLGGIIYSFLGTANNQLSDFADFYCHRDISAIINVLDHLFRDTCGHWYANRTHMQSLDLAADYRQLYWHSSKQLEQALTKWLPSVSGKQRITFTSLNNTRDFTNPVLVAADLSFVRFSYTCITHGDLNPYNLFVDEIGFTWLIDFGSTGYSHILRDLAMLDSVIRFQLLSAQDASLEERLEMEEILCNTKSFSQVKQLATNFTTSNPALAKAYTTVIHLRALAGSFVAQNQHDDIGEYYIALFYTALNTLQFSSLETIQREHALLCASLLADRLSPSGWQHR